MADGTCKQGNVLRGAVCLTVETNDSAFDVYCARAQAVAANLDKLGYTADMQFQF